MTLSFLFLALLFLPYHYLLFLFIPGSEIRQRDDDLGLAHVAIAFETGGWTSPNAFPLMIMQTLLVSGAKNTTTDGCLFRKSCQ